MADQLVVTGKFLGALPTETVGQNGFLVRKFFVDCTTNPDYPNTPEFQLRQDKVSLVDNLTKGQLIQVKFNLNGRKFRNQQTGREGIITNLDAWKIDVITTQSAAVAQAPVASRTAPAAGPAALMNSGNDQGGNDDLPF